MPLKSPNSAFYSNFKTLCSIPYIFLFFTILTALLSTIFFLHSSPQVHSSSQVSQTSIHTAESFIKVYITELPRSLNYGLLGKYWSSSYADSRITSDPDHKIGGQNLQNPQKFPPYPENPLIKQYSAEYWILGDLMSPPNLRTQSFAKRVFTTEEADVVFVPFFATLSAEMQLGRDKARFRKKEGNEDYQRQKEVIDLVRNSEAWKRSGGRDHVFVLTDPVAMWHVRAEIAPAVLLVVDFGGWFKLDSKSPNSSSSSFSADMIQHTQVSLLKDVIVPYTHLLPRLSLQENEKRHTLLYFKGAKHRHRGGAVREKLWDLLIDEPGVIMEEGFPNATGKQQSIKGMRTSEFCLHPAGDTPTSCRLFDAVQSLCIPVVVSDNIELPFEGMLDYSEFSIFVSFTDALRPKWLLSHLRSFSEEQKEIFRKKMASVQSVFEFDSGNSGGIGPIPRDGAVNHIWRKVHQKVPLIKEAIVRENRKPRGVSVPLRCHCT